MCGIFGAVSQHTVDLNHLKILRQHSKQRGKDSSGYVYNESGKYSVYRADFDIDKLSDKIVFNGPNLVLGHSRLITNGLSDNQPVLREGMAVLHNGIILNSEEVWKDIGSQPLQTIDSEVILGVAHSVQSNGGSLDLVVDQVFRKLKGQISAAVLFSKLGKLVLMSNNGSLYFSTISDTLYFSSESYPLKKLGGKNIVQLRRDYLIVDVPRVEMDFDVSDIVNRKENLIPEFIIDKHQEALLVHKENQLIRCTKCILPETMPFISFDDHGVCNYCRNYKCRNIPKPKSEIFNLIEPYRRPGKSPDCLIPFSGGRDSCYGLHLVLKELDLKPITYTYDWGMVTDLGRRNISLMCSELGVENIIVAADISGKRRNIRMNLEAWLKSPHLGMMAMLTAGDKHFFRHVETVKKQTSIGLNLWGVNPLEVTHFKTGFLGIKPDFEESRVYSHGMLKQLKYHSRRFKAMTESPGYFNSSLWDTLSGEYYRSFTDKKDYFHIFDYWRWDESEVNNTLIKEYGWETAIDTNSTWRIGDGTAAFYNYVYYTVAGFTEHDTFRSNQIREGQISREEALLLVADENRPRYQNIRWYLDTLGMDFERVIRVVNSIPKLSSKLL